MSGSGFEARAEGIGAGTLKTHVEWHGAPVSMAEAFRLLAQDAAFRRGLIAALRGAPFEAYFWETPATSASTAARRFEYVLTDAPGFLRVAPEREAFQEHFARDTDADGVVTFDNLGRDATLVVPCPRDDDRSYAHLAAFVRGAAEQQVDALFAAVGRAASARFSERPQWLSTAGMGVYWLHVRIDSRPKYYRHEPYKKG